MALAEALDAVSTGVVGLSETVALSEALATQAALNASLSETVALGEALASVTGNGIGLSESVTLVETLDAAVSLNAALSESVALAEALGANAGTGVGLSESVTLDESVASAQASAADLAENVGLTESIAEQVTPGFVPVAAFVASSTNSWGGSGGGAGSGFDFSTRRAAGAAYEDEKAKAAAAKAKAVAAAEAKSAKSAKAQKGLGSTSTPSPSSIAPLVALAAAATAAAVVAKTVAKSSKPAATSRAAPARKACIICRESYVLTDFPRTLSGAEGKICQTCCDTKTPAEKRKARREARTNPAARAAPKRVPLESLPVAVSMLAPATKPCFICRESFVLSAFPRALSGAAGKICDTCRANDKKALFWRNCEICKRTFKSPSTRGALCSTKCKAARRADFDRKRKDRLRGD